MEVNLETQELMNGVMRKESSMNSQPSTLRNKNGLVERKNRTLIDMARSMLSEYNVSDSFWAEAVNMACHASNRLYCQRFHNKAPYELLIGRKPNISYFRVFGCKCYILKKGTRLSKFQSKCDEDFLFWVFIL